MIDYRIESIESYDKCGKEWPRCDSKCRFEVWCNDIAVFEIHTLILKILVD